MSSDASVVGSETGEARRAPQGVPFSDILREQTKLVHREAERSGFIADLIRGRATREGYALFLRNLVPVYSALETALGRADSSPLLRPFADLRLWRLPCLQRDLEALAGPGWAALTVMPEASAYAAAIDRAVHDEPRLVAHAYARYLGDLSGGQVLRPLLARTLGLGPDMLNLYDFPAVADLAEPKRDMRRALDGVVPEGVEAVALVEEAIAAFRHNIAMSTAVTLALA